MSNIIYAFHTHANGPQFGWWGTATHPAHLKPNGTLDKGTTWAINVQGINKLSSAHVKLEHLVEQRVAKGGYGHDICIN